MEIRFARKEDLEQLAKIEKECFPIQEAANVTQLIERLQAFHQCFLVAEIAGKITGFINGAMISNQTISDEMFTDVSFHHIHHPNQSVFSLAVLPAFRHMGIAQKLMQAFIDLAMTRQKKAIVLTCKENLISFYQQFGYISLGISNSTHGGAIWYDMILKLDQKYHTFIPMQFYHLNDCVRLFQQCFEKEPWHEKWTYEQSFQRLKEMIVAPYVFSYVLYQDGQLAGMIIGRQMTYMERKELWIDEVCISPQFQGHHLGNNLLDFVKEECKKRNIKTLVLQTIRGFLSDHFYSQNGFHIQEHLVSMKCDI
ncbi:GNAT family N-acetyltransferase [Allocoprobacillus halotolerans]|uniref:GNAT family N-acetyltransferase n=1 Tax=Allocoprobacillus halotolerans TaxID=2944914 RepID=A0ABY5I3Y1_9FIRM|nr:GNAT family N-acetyltransferase [Allocoprobacillus halotolerans]UTY38672.1 GNAT family N-acetyltransferase [Allocoprobacillus halotolerans]